MKVLFVTAMHPTPSRPLQGVVIQRLAGALRDTGHDVNEFQVGDGPPWRYFEARARVRQVVTQFKPDILHVHFGYGVLSVPRVAVPIVTSFVGDDLYGTRTRFSGITWKSRLGILVSQLAAVRSARCIVVSASMRDELWFARCRARTRVVRDAVDPKMFRPLPREEARARLGIDPGAKLVLFPHSVSQATKRLWLAQAAVDLVRRVDPTVQLWVVNGRPADDMPWYYAAADVMIITSITEGGPSSAKEALACGLRIVSVPVGDQQLFNDAPQAMIRSAPTAQALADTLREVLLKPDIERRSYLPPDLQLTEAARAIGGVYREAVASYHSAP